MAHGPTPVVLLRRVVALFAAAILTLGALVVGGAPAQAATSRTVSIAASPAAAQVNKTVALSGTLSKSPKGSAVTLQRKSGARWLTVKTVKTTTAAGRYVGRVTLPAKAGTYSFRAVAPAKGSLRAATSAVLKVSALTPVEATIKATPKPPATLTAGASATLSGTVKPFVRGTTVSIQKFVGNRWVGTGATATLTSRGTFSKAVPVKDPTVFRVSVPRAGLKAPAVSAGTAVIADPKISSTVLPTGSVNAAYTAQLTQVGSNPGTWTVSPALPTGLTLNGSNGRITGTPTVLSNRDHVFSFAQPALRTATKTLRLTISAPVPPTIATTSLPTGEVDAAYTATLTAQGNPSGTWTTSTLPAGLQLNSSTGVISGTPTTAGSTEVTVGFTQTSTGLPATPKVLTLVVDPPPPPPAPVIATTTLPDGSRFQTYTAQLSVVGDPPGTWSVTGLPNGFTFNATTGVIRSNTLVTALTPPSVSTVTINFTATGNPTPAVPVTTTLTVN